MSRHKNKNLVTRICCAAVLALGLAACGSKTVAPATPAPVTVTQADPAASMAAQQAALAAGAAKVAADDAAAAVAAVEASQAADMPAYTDAQDAAAAALAASMAAQTASDAAGTATTTAAAQEQRDIALAKQTEAETALEAATNFAGVVQMAQQVLDDAADAEATNLADAKTAAMTAAMAARLAADDAQTAADTVADLTGDGSAQATLAQAAADLAGEAATAAEAASATAQAATMSADAVIAQTAAETERGTADTQLAMAEDLKREAQVAVDVAGRLQQERDIAAAQDAAEAASAAALAHYNSAVQNATDARAKAVAARDAADRAVRARTDFGKADEQATAAETAATAAETARDMALTAKNAADDASTLAMDATTSTDAETYQGDAETAETTAEEQATAAEEQATAAMKAAAAAETAAGTHVLGLFMSANAYDETKEKAAATEVVSVGKAIAAAAAAKDQAGKASATAKWEEDKPATDGKDAVPGLLEITFKSGVTNGGAEKEFISVTVGAANADPAVKPNATQTNVGGDFPHLFDMSSGDARVLVFTDKEQDTPKVVEVKAKAYVNAKVDAKQIASLGESRDGGTSFPGTYDDSLTDTIPGIEGTFTCTGDSCSLIYTGSGDDVKVTEVTGYTFSGSREGVTAVKADEKKDYLLFGVWLDEDADGADTFGAIATGGQPFTANNVKALEGKATYRGSAVGAHHKTGSGVSSFDGDANLTADFKDADTAGSIGGAIDNISVDGGDPMEESIHLVKTDLTTGNTFNGRAVMGQQLGPGLTTHTFNGTWSGGFFGNGEKKTDHPGSVAGTFGVTDTTGSGDDAVTESYVGAFGAHQQ